MGIRAGYEQANPSRVRVGVCTRLDRGSAVALLFPVWVDYYAIKILVLVTVWVYWTRIVPHHFTRDFGIIGDLDPRSVGIRDQYRHCFLDLAGP